LKLTGIREAYGETLAALGELYPEIVVLDADLSGSTKTSLFAKKFPDRFFNMGVAEHELLLVPAVTDCRQAETLFGARFGYSFPVVGVEQVKIQLDLQQANVKKL